jgi:hypothetical protein
LKPVFPSAEMGREGDNGNDNQTKNRLSKSILQNRSKEHEQLFKARQKFDLNTGHVVRYDTMYDVKAVIWPKNWTKNECRER